MCTSCYATHENNLRPAYFRKKELFLLCHTCILYNISIENNLRPVYFMRLVHTCFATHATYATFPMGNNLRPVYFSKQMYFLLRPQCNFWGLSKGSSGQYHAQA